MSAPEVADPEERAWMASVLESGWHAVTRSTCGGSVIATCGHRLYGPMHRRLGEEPPQDAARTVCAPCTQLAGVAPSRVPRVSPRVTWPTRDPDITWPEEDPDAEPTERIPDLESALVLLLDRTPNPGSSTLPGADRAEHTEIPLPQAA
ncbi:hypothetical protein [Haloactinomyces albus]|uniref:Uncharacterized protein n=1 Tax=Haloactinomyces albus TaxID=1352928 RepID=A0AAE4CMF1_9ACTN|nr:hypothetical protein [Haloactinomyces albus]MDR7302336.1 hypothetical protein [Haloactinomyces albus]